MERRRSSRKAAERAKSKLVETVDSLSEDENEIKYCSPNATCVEIKPCVILIRNLTNNSESSDLDRTNQENAACGILQEVNNNTELVDRNLSDANVNIPPPTNEYDENEKENWSSEKKDFCEKLRKFLKKSENLDDNGE
ncbi:hypothetical protein LSTR_LSTR014979 [Laodelphax striatellus]|uniref:Uncharacterized protein n=1 Tax=Laodelphax striatellus TaxID=195883 RepID=A0A482WQI3_LAOST|nr:hypothetical protein LSTR_LSTR014979 [Laodelphax striatellus]